MLECTDEVGALQIDDLGPALADKGDDVGWLDGQAVAVAGRQKPLNGGGRLAGTAGRQESPDHRPPPSGAALRRAAGPQP